MDAIELAKLFVEYNETNQKLMELEQKIKDAVGELAESQHIAGVRAIYYGESVEYDYEKAARSCGVTETEIAQHTTMTPKVSWKAVCEAIKADLDAPGVAIRKPARVVVKIKET